MGQEGVRAGSGSIGVWIALRPLCVNLGLHLEGIIFDRVAWRISWLSLKNFCLFVAGLAYKVCNFCGGTTVEEPFL